MFMFWACASAWGMAHKSQNQGQERLWSTWDLPPHFSYQLFHYKLWLIMSPNLRPPFLRFNNIPKALDLRTACLNNNNAYLYISLFAKHFLRHYFIWSSWKPWKDRQLFSHSFTDEETDLTEVHTLVMRGPRPECPDSWRTALSVPAALLRCFPIEASSSGSLYSKHLQADIYLDVLISIHAEPMLHQVNATGLGRQPQTRGWLWAYKPELWAEGEWATLEVRTLLQT